MPLLNFSDKPILICKDHTVSGESFELRKDEQLDLLGTFPRPAGDKLPEYYKSEKYISHTDSKSSIFDKTYQAVKSFMLRKKLSWILDQTKKPGRILDFGAGTGDFLAEAKNHGWIVDGVEPNEDARKLAFKKGLYLKDSTAGFKDSSFDVISLWHVLEHVPDLEKQILELKRLLKTDGLLIIAVPNYKSYDAKKYGRFWAAYDVPRHLYHFSQISIEKIFSKFSIELLFKKPLKFDAFYVSLLSEKYAGGNANPVKAFLTAAKSNYLARTSGEYSSLTYFLQKK